MQIKLEPKLKSPLIQSWHEASVMSSMDACSLHPIRRYTVCSLYQQIRSGVYQEKTMEISANLQWDGNMPFF